MCGRFTQGQSQLDVETRFDVQGSLFAITPQFNISPTQAIAVITAQGPRMQHLLEPMQWGLVPSWAKDTSIAAKMINARSETVLEKPSFRTAISRRRCLVIADGFYEWDKVGGTKVPRHFHLKNRHLFAMAGLWEEWESPDGSALRSCTVLTTESNSLIAPYHERMPVILAPEKERAWLDVARVRPADLTPLYTPFPSSQMGATVLNKPVPTVTAEDLI
jgi:putative SOS response-associated peptidase YedK